MKDKKILMQPNNIVKSHYNIDAVENRIFMFILYKLQKTNSTTLSCEISFKEFQGVIKKNDNKTLESITNMLSELRKGTIEIKDNDKWIEYGFINGFTFDKTTNTFTIEASEKIYNSLFEYLKGYTPKNLDFFLRLRNFNAQRFYDLLRLWSGTKSTINYSIEDIKKYLKLENQYPEYGNFKRRVIIPAINELNKNEIFSISFQENKIGRKVVSIDFFVKDLDKRKYFTKQKN